MNSTSSRKSRHGRWKISIAMLAASAAFVGGAALAPAPAGAMITNEGAGLEECAFWIDCFVQPETGGGGGEPSGGGGLTGGGGSGGGGEVVVIVDTKPTPTCGTQGYVCPPIGGGRPPLEIGQDGGTPQGEVGGGARNNGLPPCASGKPADKRPGCSQHSYKCKADGKVKWVNSEKECKDLQPPEPKPERVREFRKKRSLCASIQQAKDDLDDKQAKGLIDTEDWEELRDDLHRKWLAKGCDDLPENPV